MNAKTNATIELIEGLYKALFKDVATLGQLRYGEKVSAKLDSIKKVTERLSKDGFLSEYLYTNLSRLYDAYPEIKEGKKLEQGWLDDLYALLTTVNNDIQEEINALMEEGQEHEAEMLEKEIIG